MEGPSGVSPLYLYVLTTNFHCPLYRVAAKFLKELQVPHPRALLTELRTLADCLQDCHSVEDVTAVLREQAQDFKKFQEKDKVLKPLKRVLTVLYLLSSAPSIAQHVGLVRSKALTDVQRL